MDDEELKTQFAELERANEERPGDEDSEGDDGMGGGDDDDAD